MIRPHIADAEMMLAAMEGMYGGHVVWSSTPAIVRFRPSELTSSCCRREASLGSNARPNEASHAGWQTAQRESRAAQRGHGGHCAEELR